VKKKVVIYRQKSAKRPSTSKNTRIHEATAHMGQPHTHILIFKIEDMFVVRND